MGMRSSLEWGKIGLFRVVVPSCVLFHLTDHLIDNFRLYCITFLLGQLPIINRFQFTFTFHLHCFMPSTRQKRKWSIQVNFKQQIDTRLGIYNQSPVVFAFLGARKRQSLAWTLKTRLLFAFPKTGVRWAQGQIFTTSLLFALQNGSIN